MTDITADVLEIFQPSLQITPTLAKPTRVELWRVSDAFLTLFENLYFKGFGRIAGTTEVSGFPDVPIGNRKVYLLDQKTMTTIAMAVSNGLGEYEFDYLDMSRRYVVVAFYDGVPTFRAVIADGVAAEPM